MISLQRMPLTDISSYELRNTKPDFIDDISLRGLQSPDLLIQQRV